MVAPWMMWGALAAGIPIALHFFFRSRFRTVPWAAMKFLLLSIEQTSRRLRFQELLLLMLRVAVIVILAFALSRPRFWSGGGTGAGGDAVDAVFVFDTSLSMGVREGDQTRLQKAKNTALAVIANLPAGSTVRIVTCADRAKFIGPDRPTNLEKAEELVANLQLSHLATDLHDGLQEAFSILSRSQASNKEFYLFSDMQRTGWEKQSENTKKLIKDLAEKAEASVMLVRCGDSNLRKELKNVAVVSVTPQSGVPRPGQRIGFSVLLHNTGQKPANELTVSLTVDHDEKNKDSRPVPTLQPGQKRTVALSGKIDKAGLRVLTVKLETDDLEADNQFDQVLSVRDQVNVLVVDGSYDRAVAENSASYNLLYAMTVASKSKDEIQYLQPTLIEPDFATAAQLKTHDLCILANVALQPIPGQAGTWLHGNFVKALDQYVRDGNGLMVFAGDRVEPKPYNKILGEKYGMLPWQFVESEPTDFTKAPLFLSRSSVNLPALRRFKEEDFYKSVGTVEVYKALQLKEPFASIKNPPSGKKKKSQAQVVMRYSNDWPAVVSKKHGDGEIIWVTTAANAPSDTKKQWNKWSIDPLYLPFVRIMMNHLLHQQTQNHNLKAGDTLLWETKDTEKKSYVLAHPNGKDEETLGFPEKQDGRQLVKATNLLQAGVYTISTQPPPGAETPKGKKEISVPLAVVPDLSETQNLDVLTEEQMKSRFENIDVTYVTAGVNDEAFSQINRANREWTTWLLIILLVLVVGEMFFAWWCGRAW